MLWPDVCSLLEEESCIALTGNNISYLKMNTEMESDIVASLPP